MSCVLKEGIAFQEDLTVTPALKPTTTTLEGHISIFEETHSKDRARERKGRGSFVKRLIVSVENDTYVGNIESRAR